MSSFVFLQTYFAAAYLLVFQYTTVAVVFPKTKILDSLHMNVAVVFAASLKPTNALCPPVVVLPSRSFFSFCVSISLRAACVYDDGIY